MEGAVGPAQGAELHRDEGALAAAALQGLVQQHLVLPGAVEVAGVDQVDAGVERGVHGRDALGIVGRPVAAGERHAAEPEGGDARAVAAELAMIQDAPVSAVSIHCKN